MDLRWNEAELVHLLDSDDGPVGQDLRAKGRAVKGRAKALCPVSEHGSNGNPPGHLRDSIEDRGGRDEAGMFVEVGTDVDYALYPELGTAPHVIEPRDKQALSWPGAAHPVARVEHPGTEATPYLRPALEAIRDTR